MLDVNPTSVAKEGLLQQWLSQLPIATSLWQRPFSSPHPPHPVVAGLPCFMESNTHWQTLTQNQTDFNALTVQIVFSVADDEALFKAWLALPSPTTPFTAKITLAPPSISDAEPTTGTDSKGFQPEKTPQFKMTVAPPFSSTKADDYDYFVLSLTPFCEEETLGQAHHEFLSVLSHEFRTPLTSIQGFADTLIHFGSKLPEAQQRRCLSLISDQTKRLNRMVENLLSASKLEAQVVGHQQAKPVVLNLLLQKVLQTIAGKGHPPHQVAIRLPQTMPPLWGNPDRLEQVLLNLIDNAFKYSPANSTVSILADITTHHAENQVRLTIEDEGIGLTPDQQEQLFTKFYRASNPLTQNVEGTGLGLYITKVLVQQLEGSITVAHSTPNKGTCFELILPLATTQRIQQKVPLLLQGESDNEATAHG